jgi:hypothetical protein
LTVNWSIVDSSTTVRLGATLSRRGITTNVTVLGGGILSPWPRPAILDTGNVVLDPHSHFISPSRLGGANQGSIPDGTSADDRITLGYGAWRGSLDGDYTLIGAQ